MPYLVGRRWSSLDRDPTGIAQRIDSGRLAGGGRMWATGREQRFAQVGLKRWGEHSGPSADENVTFAAPAGDRHRDRMRHGRAAGTARFPPDGAVGRHGG